MAIAADSVVSSDFDPFSSETRRDPYGTYERLRELPHDVGHPHCFLGKDITP